MTDLQGAVGLVQLEKMEQFISERQRWADFYQKELASIEWLKTPAVPADCKHGWQAYVCFVDESKAPFFRNETMEKLQAKGIHTRPGTHAVHLLGYYRERFGFEPDDFPNSKLANDCSMAIPLHNRMSAEDHEYVVECLCEMA